MQPPRDGQKHHQQQIQEAGDGQIEASREAEDSNCRDAGCPKRHLTGTKFRPYTRSSAVGLARSDEI